MVAFPQLLGPGYTLFSKKAESQLSINCWREQVQSGQGVSAFTMYRSPGLEVFLEVPNAPSRTRGFLEQNDHLFTVQNDYVYDYDAAVVPLTSVPTATYGPIADDGDPVTLAASADSLMICSANTLYRINSGALSTIALAFTPAWVVFLKNYFVVGEANSSRFYWSEDDGATFDPANVQTAEADNNFILMGAVLHQMLWVVGNRVTQVFYVGTNADAPFVPNDGAVINSGTDAPYSVCVFGETIYWKERTKNGANSFVQVNGFTPQKVSNNYISNLLDQMGQDADLSDAIAQPFQIGDHGFIRWTFAEADKTLELHVNYSEWEEVAWWDLAAGEYHRHRGNQITYAFGKVIVGDHTLGLLYEMSQDTYYDYGYPLRMLRRTPHIVGESNKRIAFDRLDVGAEMGVGLEEPLWLQAYTLDPATFAADIATLVGNSDITIAQALVFTLIYDGLRYIPFAQPYADPQIMYDLGFYPWGGTAEVQNDQGETITIGSDPLLTLRYSNDGGESYSNELSRSLGALGQKRRAAGVSWNRMSECIDRVWELTYDAPCKLCLTGAWLNDPEELLS